MASGGSDLSTRMSAENKKIHDIALCHFKKMKIEISNIIKVAFPFLERLRDYGFISNKMYEKSKKSFKTPGSEQEVIYHILNNVEKTFNLTLLEALFSKEIMETYPGLNHIYETFKKVIPDLELFLGRGEKHEERPNDELSFEQAISSEDSTESSDGEKTPEASTSAMKRKPGTMDPGNNSIPEKPKRKRTRPQTDGTVNFRSEILPVTCREMKGMLIKRKFERGTMVKCIRSRNGKWFTVREFQVEGGYSNATNWKDTVRCGGRSLQCLMEQQILPNHVIHGRRTDQEDSKKCTVCLDEGKLFKCISCSNFFHGDCRFPPVEHQRIRWKCTFCTIQTSTGSQECYSKSEVLARKMGPEEKLKCEFLLLKVYCHLERVVFPNIQPEKYVSKASQCLVKLRKLDKIKKKLIEGRYRQIKGFVGNVDNIFQNFNHYGSKEEYEKNFKEIFAIQ